MSLHILNKKLNVKNITFSIIFSLFFIAGGVLKVHASDKKESEKTDKLKVNKIIIVRKCKNSYLSDQSIRNCIPYKTGEDFNPNKTSRLIRNLYDIGKPFSYFNQVQVMGKVLDKNLTDLYVITHEKSELDDVIITGNKKIKKKEIDDLFKFSDIHAINEIDLKKIVQKIRKLYRDNDFHLVEISSELKTENNKTIAYICINENKKSLVKRVFFKGNNNINDKRLREIIFTREDWILGFLNKAGTYRQENLDQDKHILENYYKSNGYFMAKIVDTEVKMDPVSKQYAITFFIQEGDLYTIKEVKAEGNDIVPQELILKVIPVKCGNLYSAKDIRDSIEFLRTLWGQYGYVFADIEPVIVPDEKNKTVSVTFNSEVGDKVYINRINILGNKKTKDHVIRRKLILEEGDLLTTTAMDISKDRIESLSYFNPQNGANWKINRIDDKTADLDLIVNEIKTGRIIANMGIGGSPKNLQSITRSFKIGASAYDTNLFGEGLRLRLDGEWSKEEWTIAFNLTDPWFLNRPIYTELEFFVTKSDYVNELKNVNDLKERIIGAFVGSGFTTSRYSWLFKEASVMFKLGIEDLEHNRNITVTDNAPGSNALQAILRRRFQDGTIISLINKVAQDTRNHGLHPSHGYQWSVTPKMGLAGGNGCLSYMKIEADASCYMPLIGENTLVFGLHGFFGMVGSIDDKIIPYRELFHIGGPASVRGFLWGQIGPSFLGDSIGAKKAFFINAELIFPITKSFSVKGAVFYDGGAGWDSPDLDRIPINDRGLIVNNHFEYRHAIGFGIRMLSPTPMKIDWGFKLDKKKGEKVSELHLSMYKDF